VEERFELTAAVVLWRGDEILVMKRSYGFSPGGWFLPAGHLEGDERPEEAAVRELREETEIVVEPAALALATVMSYPHDGATAHCLVYNASAPPGAEPVLNGEHAVARWYTPEAFAARFLDPAMLRQKGVPEPAVALAAEVARTVFAAARARGAAPPA
jgi:ADP-ribose pyrophosphatase YjhB (NUDIX family)